MKSERRHKLQHNTLDAELSKGVAFFKRNLNRILTVVLIILVAVVGMTWLNRKSDEADATIQNRYDTLKNEAAMPSANRQNVIAGLRELGEQNNVKWIAADSRMMLGKLYATDALTSELPAERETAEKEARACYSQVVRDYIETMPWYAAAAYVGMGKLDENKGDFAAAAANYETATKLDGIEGYPILRVAKDALVNAQIYKGDIVLATHQPEWAKKTPLDATTSQPAAPATQPANKAG